MAKTRLLLIPILIFTILACSCSNNADVRPETTLPTDPLAVDAADITSEETAAEAATNFQITLTEPTTEAETVSTTSPTTEATSAPTTVPTTEATLKSTTAPTTKAPATTTAPKTKSEATQTEPSEAVTTVSEDEDVLLDDEEEVLEPVISGLITHVDEQYTDYIIYDRTVYICDGPPMRLDGSHTSQYIPGDKLMEITEVSSNRELAELSDGTASILPVGTEIYKCRNKPEFILALVGEEYVPYFGLREG